jgi:enoyl-[acyl-carrier protein] reductase II
MVLEARDGSTDIILKKIIPVRLIRNKFHDEVKAMESQGASREQLMELLGHGRAKKGMFEGNLDEGELEIGQVSGLIHEIKPAGKIVEEMVEEYNGLIGRLGDWRI